MEKPNPPPKTKMHAYIILLHLRSQGWTSYTDIKKLFCWKYFKSGFTIGCVGYIHDTIRYLSKKWCEEIPRINAFCFTRGTECPDPVCKEIFGKSGEADQPRPQEIAAYAAKIAAYPKWDKIIEHFRREAFEACEREPTEHH